jgi:hypothetical protein
MVVDDGSDSMTVVVEYFKIGIGDAARPINRCGEKTQQSNSNQSKTQTKLK